MCKIFLSGHDIPQLPYNIIDLQKETKNQIVQKINEIQKNLSLPLYVKPCNSGSSVGITKVKSFQELQAAIDEAIKHDSKIVIEQGLVHPKEIEVAILGNSELTISQPGELLLAKDFYSYDDKYKLNQASVKIPTDIPKSQQDIIKQLAEKIYQLCDCSGFARLDFFVADDQIYFNEINTLP